jgi:molybdate transport system regulatory protein
MPTRDPLSSHLVPRVKVWFSFKLGFLMGPNYLRFLEAVEKTGTIRGAAEAAGWSYRTCLNRVRQMEDALGQPVLVTTRGGSGHGGSKLTPVARRLLRIFRAWRTDVQLLSDRAFRKAARRF